MPASNLIWADRQGSIGYKLIGRLPIRKGGCPDLPKPGWTGEFEWEGTVPYEELPEVVDPESGFLVTANNRIVGDDYPHHITSDWLDGYRAKRIEELLRASEEHDIDDFEAMQSDNLSIPASTPPAASAASAGDPAREQRGRAPAQLGRPARAGDDRRHDLPGLPAALRPRGGACRYRRPRPRRALARPRRQRLHPPCHLALALALPPAELWEEGEEELLGRSWDELALECLGGALDDLADRFGPDPEGWRWGRVHEME